MELGTLDDTLGELAVTPDKELRDEYHSATTCPSVVPGFRVVRPGDNQYAAVLELEWCDWCRLEWLGLDHDQTAGRE